MMVMAVIHSSVFAGPHNQILQTVTALRDAEVDLLVVLPREPGDAAQRLRAEGIEVLQEDLVRPRLSRSTASLAFVTQYSRQVRRLTDLARDRGVDVVQIHGLMHLDGALVARRCGSGLVWQLIDTRPSATLRRLLMPLVLRMADVVMTTGETVARAYPGAVGLRREGRLVTFVPPVDPSMAPLPGPERRRARASLGARSDDTLLVGSLGNLNPQKGHDALLRAVGRLRAVHPSVLLRIRGAVSPGHELHAEKLRVTATQYGLDDSTIAALGAMPVRAFLAALDVFVISSGPRSEGIPTTMLESMRVGTPVVATDVGGVCEVLSDAGLVVKSGSLDEMAVAVASLLDPDRRRRLSSKGRERALAFTNARCATAHLRAYCLAADRATRRERAAL